MCIRDSPRLASCLILRPPATSWGRLGPPVASWSLQGPLEPGLPLLLPWPPPWARRTPGTSQGLPRPPAELL
eukprot:6344617-Pyramimonas_sp.AAC.1